MAIERRDGRAELRVGAKAAKKAAGKLALKKSAKKAAKHVAEKHAAKKAPGKKAAKKSPAKKGAKQAGKHPGIDRMLHGGEGTLDEQMDAAGTHLTDAFHHLHRATSVVSLLDRQSGADLKMLLEHGMDVYRSAHGHKSGVSRAKCAFGLLRAAEHLSMAGLYEARSAYRVEVAPPSRTEVGRHLRELGPRLDDLGPPSREDAQRLCEMARELLRRAEGSEHDPHLEYELTMAAEGICMALEEGL